MRGWIFALAVVRFCGHARNGTLLFLEKYRYGTNVPPEHEATTHATWYDLWLFPGVAGGF